MVEGDGGGEQSMQVIVGTVLVSNRFLTPQHIYTCTFPLASSAEPATALLCNAELPFCSLAAIADMHL